MLAVVCTFLFLLRSLVILLNQFLFTYSLGILFGVTINELFCEFTPTLFILVVLCWPTHRIPLAQIDRKQRIASYHASYKSVTPIS